MSEINTDQAPDVIYVTGKPISKHREFEDHNCMWNDNPYWEGEIKYIKADQAPADVQLSESFHNRVTEFRKQIKPSYDAQAVRSKLAFDLDVDDETPDYLWDVVDLSAQLAMDKISAKDKATIAKLRDALKKIASGSPDLKPPLRSIGNQPKVYQEIAERVLEETADND